VEAAELDVLILLRYSTRDMELCRLRIEVEFGDSDCESGVYALI